MLKDYKIQFLILAGCISGVVWLVLANSGVFDHSICMIKNISGYPCPSCGSTRSIQALLDLDLVGSLLINPFGIILVTGFLVLLPWSVYDLVKQKNTISHYYHQLENKLKNRSLVLFLISLVLINWIWNIMKNL